MSIESIISIIISILGSSLLTLVLSTLVFNPLQNKKQYIFDEKKKVYESIIVFSQIILYPQEAKFSLRVARYNIQELSDEENVKNSINDLKMAIPKLRLITKNDRVIIKTNAFIESKDLDSFNNLVSELRNDLYK